MSIEEIRKNAPDGATHYSYILKKYFQINKNELWVYGYMWKYHSRIKHPRYIIRNQIKPLH